MTPSMVSRAFNPKAQVREDKRQRVLEAAAKYDFYPNQMASRLSMEPVRIGVILNVRYPATLEQMMAGLAAAHQMRKDYKLEYDVTVLRPLEEACDYQAAFEEYLSHDGLIIAGFSAERFAPLIERYRQVNPNLVQVQAINPSIKSLCAVHHPAEQASALAAEFLHHCLKRSGQKNILLFTGDLESALHRSAQRAFLAHCAAYGMNILETVDMQDSERLLEQQLPQMFQNWGRSVDGIYITSGASGPLCRYLEAADIDPVLVTFDVHSEIQTYLRRGVISATVSQNVSGQMETAFRVLAEYLIGNLEPEPIIHSDVQLLMKSNLPPNAD